MVTPAGPTSPGAGTDGSWGTTASTPPHRRRSVLATVLAIVIVAAGIGAAVALFAAAGERYDDNVAGFARAPVGCDTTLEFERVGEFVLYLETSGRIDGLGGDCDLADSYDRASDGLPRPVLALRSADVDADVAADEVDLAPTAGVDYDTGDFVGTAYRLADVPAAGEYVLTVDDGDGGEPYAIAVGRDPAAGVAALRWGALGALLAGLLIGGAVFVLGRRRATPTPPPPGPTDSSAEGAVWSPWAPASTHIDPLLGRPAGYDPEGWPQGPPMRPAPPNGSTPYPAPPWAAPQRPDPFDQ